MTGVQTCALPICCLAADEWRFRPSVAPREAKAGGDRGVATATQSRFAAQTSGEIATPGALHPALKQTGPRTGSRKDSERTYEEEARHVNRGTGTMNEDAEARVSRLARQAAPSSRRCTRRTSRLVERAATQRAKREVQ